MAESVSAQKQPRSAAQTWTFFTAFLESKRDGLKSNTRTVRSGEWVDEDAFGLEFNSKACGFSALKLGSFPS